MLTSMCINLFDYFIAPRIFPIIYNLFKPFMDENTKRRVFILGGTAYTCTHNDTIYAIHVCTCTPVLYWLCLLATIGCINNNNSAIFENKISCFGTLKQSVIIIIIIIVIIIIIIVIVMLADDYKEVLLQHIAPDQLPEVFGGERREPDPKCTDYVSY